MPHVATASPDLMSSQNKSPFGLRILFGLVLLWTLSLTTSTSARTCDELTILKIPALGIQASLGELFDERNGHFRKSNVFRSSVPMETIVATKRPSKVTDFRIIRHDHQYTDKFQLLKVDENTAVNILVGVVEVEVGSSQFLTETSNVTAVNGALIFRQQTVTESLQSFYDALRPFYNRVKLNHNSATHIVTGILWGGQAVVSVTAHVSQGQVQGRREVENRMRSEFKLLVQNQSLSNATSYSFNVWEDVEFSLINDGQLINNLSEALLTTADGKGVELEYTLTPLCMIREFLEVPSLRNVAVKNLNHSTLQGIIGILDQIMLAGQDLDCLDNKLELHSACVSEEARAGLQSIQNGFTKSMVEFKESVEESVVKVRSGKMAEPDLAVILDEYTEAQFGAKKVQLMLAEFNETLAQIDFYNYIQSKFKNIQYIGASGNLRFDGPSSSKLIMPESVSRESDASTRMYLLYYKHAWTVEKVDAWLGSSQVFFENLQKDALSNSRKFCVIDCDFVHLHCGNISQPTIHEYSNGKLTSSNYVVTVGETQRREALIQCYEARNYSEAVCNPKKACFNGGMFIPAAGDEDSLCSCKPGYSGTKCETVIDNCDSDPCQNNGWCQNRVNSYTCICQIGYTGKNCDRSVNWCSRESVPCKNGGRCKSNAISFTCDCNLPWTGPFCEEKVDPCAIRPCLNGATCTTAANLRDYVCHCEMGHTGNNCERVFDNCESNPCQNSGWCQNRVNSYTCICQIGFTGKNCDRSVDWCSRESVPCKNGGRCKSNAIGFTCDCDLPWTGPSCEQKMDPCASKPCMNGATCTAAVDLQDYACQCKEGHSGQKCEMLIDNCGSNPCLNNGWCQNEVNSYTCKCQIGFAGENCADPVDWCALKVKFEVPCKHGGACRNNQVGFDCDCVSPWIGQSCENQFDPCSLGTCMNGATCKPVNNVLGYVCKCKNGYNGTFCEIDIDECALNTHACLNGGSCVDQVNGFKCTCPPGFNGQFCEKDIDECALNSNMCLNGGSCVDEINGFKCTCPVLFNGSFCESSECTALPAEVLATQPGLKPTSLACGGIIPFPSNQRYHLFTFRPSQINSTNNRYLWSFNDVNTGKWCYTLLKVTLMCSRFSQTKSHLSLHYYSPNLSNEHLQTLKLTNSAKVVDLTAQFTKRHFLSFFSEETDEPVTFTILVDAVHKDGDPNSVHSYKDVSGSQTFGSFSSYTMFSMAVNPAKARTTFSVDLFRTGKYDACSYFDTLVIYEISGKDEPKRLGRFCDSLPLPVSFTSEYPVLFLQYVVNHYRTSTLTISWT